MKTVNFKGVGGTHIFEAQEMTLREFLDVVSERDSPNVVYVADIGYAYYNDYTCLGYYNGTCNCYSHPYKSWIEFNPISGESGESISAKSLTSRLIRLINAK